MDRAVQAISFEDEVAELIRLAGVERAEAITIVALRRGEVIGEGDLVALRALTEEERQKSGLSHSLDQVMAAQQMRRRRNSTKPSNGSPERPNDVDARRE